jgi:hypothetical protein
VEIYLIIDILLHQSEKEFNSCDSGGDEFKFYLEIKRTNDHLVTRSSRVQTNLHTRHTRREQCKRGTCRNKYLQA